MNIEIPTDKVINPTRNRALRNTVLGLYFAGATLAIVPGLHTLATMVFPGNDLVSGLAWGLGVMGAVATLGYTIPKSFLIWNAPNQMFVTQNLLNSFFGSDEVDVAYGPGTHSCYPWEKRNQSSNISLEESTVTFKFEIMLPDGLLKGSAAYWLRPDHMNPVVFLRGVASVGEEIQNLISAKIQDLFASPEFRAKSIDTTDTTIIVKLINDYLKKEFGDDEHKAEAEARNGVIISGATVERLLPSEELQRTLSAISEARAVQKGTAMILGMSEEGAQTALGNGTLTQAEVTLARRDFLSISGNLEGITIDRKEFDIAIRGLDPEAMKALAELAKTPAATDVAARVRGGDKPRGKST